MNFHIITIFPRIFDSYFNESILKRAREKGIIGISVYDLRDWTADAHKTVDDKPFGGGPGMVMLAEPIIRAIKDVESRCSLDRLILLFSAKGERWDQIKAKSYQKFDDIIMVCGRYEGVDERVLEFVDAEVSIGDYVLTGGEIPAMVVVDSVARLLPGVLGNRESSISESHETQGLLEYPQYTRPEVLEIDGRKMEVPPILLSGHHRKIDEWREGMKRRRVS
jgi:tRNA (guanine37-N1)-methyltransferase